MTLEKSNVKPKTAKESESVNHPMHYNIGKIEAIEVIEDWQLDFILGSAVKYICRFRSSGSAVDLEKCKWYINRAIENRS